MKGQQFSGIEDKDDDPLQMLLEDITDEVQDYQAEKVQKKNEEKNKEAALVAGGKQLCDKAAVQVMPGSKADWCRAIYSALVVLMAISD